MHRLTWGRAQRQRGFICSPPAKSSQQFYTAWKFGLNKMPPYSTLPDLALNTQQESEAYVRVGEEGGWGWYWLRIASRDLQKRLIYWSFFFSFQKTKTFTTGIRETASVAAAATRFRSQKATAFLGFIIFFRFCSGTFLGLIFFLSIPETRRSIALRHLHKDTQFQFFDNQNSFVCKKPLNIF